MFKLFTSVQLDPSHNSVFTVFDGYPPPKANEAVLLVPAAPGPCLAVFKSLTSVHEVPSQDSVNTLGLGLGVPPKNKADVCVPSPPPLYLTLFIIYLIDYKIKL